MSTARPPAGEDRRRWPCNGRVAAEKLRGRAEADRFAVGTPAAIALPVTDLRSAPSGARDRQLSLGAPVTVYEIRGGWAFVETGDDGYTGYVWESALGPAITPTHVVLARSSQSYAGANLKTPDRMRLSMGSRLQVTGTQGRFVETAQGFVPEQHVVALDKIPGDAVALAERLLGTPYLWGGNSSWGIDCSGLVQLPLRLLGRDCPGDSDMQAAELGEMLDEDTPLQRGDLLFWRGHVAWVADAGETILHANAGSMSVAFEPLAEALERIEAGGDGKVTARRRP